MHAVPHQSQGSGSKNSLRQSSQTNWPQLSPMGIEQQQGSISDAGGRDERRGERMDCSGLFRIPVHGDVERTKRSKHSLVSSLQATPVTAIVWRSQPQQR